ncbi:GTPase Era [Desulforegula conservatrix]|uniref:GTPase Era n=1 Tax=Desulforegula conservatrix TaxID=153026 RepID=UPI00042265A4|nr:GTPase Era [Desulforegula conservatrix]
MGIKEEHKCGFIAIVGAPNAGKSTLLNKIIGEKIAITSKKPQTTRNRILGILNRPSSQMIFVDTPGVHKTNKVFNARIVDTAISAMGDADLILLVVDASESDREAEDYTATKLREFNKPVILVLNKTDIVHKPALLEMIKKWTWKYEFLEIIPVSAEKGDQVDVLIDSMEKALPESPALFPEDQLTDLPERFLCAEIIREKVFRLTGDEIPYATAVTIEVFSEEAKLVRIEAAIHVERDSQKGIIIGKGGLKLKEIGSAARADLEVFLGTKVFLQTFVRVQKNWTRDGKSLRNFGY